MDPKAIIAFCEEHEKNEEEMDSIYSALVHFNCEPGAGVKCPRFMAILKHVDIYCRDYVFHMSSNVLIKEQHDEEFWRHAPSNLLDAKKMLEIDPWNHFQMDRFSILIKIYKYMLEYPDTVLSVDKEERRRQKREICRHVSAHMWENWDTE